MTSVDPAATSTTVASQRPIRTVDYHTAGEPFRIVTGGVPELEGRSVLERRRWARDHLDEVRRLLVNEPRGHADMYGAFVTSPDDDWADIGVVFFHNEGYSTACGHGTIALVTWALESGRVAAPPDARTASVTVDVPSGRLVCEARLDEVGAVEAVRFRNVPSFVLARDVTVRVGSWTGHAGRRIRWRVLRLPWRPPHWVSASSPPTCPSSSRSSASSGRHSNVPLMSCIQPRPTSPASTG